MKKVRTESPDLLNADFGDLLNNIHTQSSVISSSMPVVNEKKVDGPRRYSRFMVVLRMGTAEDNFERTRMFKLLCCDDSGDLCDRQITVYLRDDNYDITEHINPGMIIPLYALGEYLNIVGMIPDALVIIIDSKRYKHTLLFLQSINDNNPSRYFNQRHLCSG